LKDLLWPIPTLRPFSATRFFRFVGRTDYTLQKSIRLDEIGEALDALEKEWLKLEEGVESI